MGITFLISGDIWRLLTLSKNGAIYAMNLEEEDDVPTLVTEKLLTHICRHCTKSIKTSQKLREHIVCHHLGPVKCVMCNMLKEDLMELRGHKKSCGYSCGVDGCEMKHKTSLSAINHKKKYLKNI